MNREFIGGLAITADTTAGDQSLSNGVVKTRRRDAPAMRPARRRSPPPSGRAASAAPTRRQSRAWGRGEEVKLLTLAVQLVGHGDGSGR